MGPYVTTHKIVMARRFNLLLLLVLPSDRRTGFEIQLATGAAQERLLILLVVYEDWKADDMTAAL